MNILVIESSRQGNHVFDTQLGQAGNRVEYLHDERADILADVAIEHLRNVAETYDALILDINFGNNNPFGGCTIYTILIREGLREKWNHTIVFSLYGGDSDKKNVLLTFAEASFIPAKNVIGKDESNEVVLRRMKEIVSGPKSPIVTLGQ